MKRTLFTLFTIFTLGACQSRGDTQTRTEEQRSPSIAVPAATERTELPEHAAPRVDPGAITIDGRLDEWPPNAFTASLVHPGSGAPVADSPVRGRAALAWDDVRLYLAFVVADADASSPNARDDVDPHVWEAASGVELMLQPGDPGDNREYYEIQVDVNEAVWDTRFDDYNRPITGEGAERRYGHQDWDAGLERSVVVEPGAGYVVEAALPWSALSSTRTDVPPKVGDAWRANLYTFRDGQRHSLAWSPLLGEGNFHRASRFGRVRFE